MIKNTTNESQWLSLFPPCSCSTISVLHPQTKPKQDQKYQTAQVFNDSVDRALESQPHRMCQNLSTFLLTAPFGSLSKRPSTLCSKSKNSGWLLSTGAVCANVLFAFSLPASVISALQTHSIPRTLLCQLFFIIAQTLEDNSGTAVYRDSLSLPLGTQTKLSSLHH